MYHLVRDLIVGRLGRDGAGGIREILVCSAQFPCKLKKIIKQKFI